MICRYCTTLVSALWRQPIQHSDPTLCECCSEQQNLIVLLRTQLHVKLQSQMSVGPLPFARSLNYISLLVSVATRLHFPHCLVKKCFHTLFIVHLTLGISKMIAALLKSIFGHQQAPDWTSGLDRWNKVFCTIIKLLC